MITWIISSTVLMAVIIALRYLLRGKIRPMAQYALWGLVLVRLLLPFSIARSPFSVSSAVEQSAWGKDMEQLQYVERVDRAEDGTIRGWMPMREDPYGNPMMSYTKVADSADDAQLLRWQRTAMVKSFAQRVLLPLWRVGIGVMAAWFLAVNAVFFRRLRRSRQEVSQNGNLPVYVTDAVETPCLFGLLSPAIYVTPEVMKSDIALQHVIAHETVHYRHGDHVWAFLRVACLCLHWFNPLVWWSAALSRRDGELACDEGAIRTLGEAQRTDYGRTLIGLSCAKSTPSDLLATATTMTGSKRSLKERVSFIAKKPHVRAAAVFILAAIAVLAAVITFPGALPQGSYIQGRGKMHGYDQAPPCRFELKEDVPFAVLRVEEYQQDTLMHEHAFSYRAEQIKSVCSRVNIDESGLMVLQLETKGDRGEQSNNIFLNCDEALNFSYLYFPQTRKPQAVTPGDRVQIFQLYYNGTDISDYQVEVWAEFYEELPAEEPVIESSGMMGKCDYSHTYTTPEGNASTFYSFEGLEKATLTVELYENGTLVQEGHKEVRNLAWLEAQIHENDMRSATPLVGDTEHIIEADWFAVLSNSDDQMLDLGFTARGIPHFSHYLDGNEFGADGYMTMETGETYCVASAAWGEDNGYFCKEYQDDPTLLAKPEKLLLFTLTPAD